MGDGRGAELRRRRAGMNDASRPQQALDHRERGGVPMFREHAAAVRGDFAPDGRVILDRQRQVLQLPHSAIGLHVPGFGLACLGERAILMGEGEGVDARLHRIATIDDRLHQFDGRKGERLESPQCLGGGQIAELEIGHGYTPGRGSDSRSVVKRKKPPGDPWRGPAWRRADGQGHRRRTRRRR